MKIWDNLHRIKIKVVRKLGYLSEGVYYVSADELGAAQHKKRDMYWFPRDACFLRQEVHTLADVIQYVRASFFRPRKGDIRIWEDSIIWHHNRSGPEAICMNTGNCGSVSSLLHYLLKDKYREVGFVAISDHIGGHVFNYIYQDGRYYLVDLLNYLYASKSIDHLSTMIYQADSLDHYAAYYRTRIGRPVLLMAAYEAKQVLPMGRRPGQPLMYFPAGTELKVLHETPQIGVTVKWHPLSQQPPKLQPCCFRPLSQNVMESKG